jgi:hypothetical protein
MVKAMITQPMEEKQDEHKDILHTIQIFEGKFEVVCKVVFGISITVTLVEEEKKGK